VYPENQNQVYSPRSLVFITASPYLCHHFFFPFLDLDLTWPMRVNSQAAIVRGAAIRGLEGTVPDKLICRRHYGFSWGLPFRVGIDEERYGYTSFGSKFCSGHMNWMIAKVCLAIVITVRKR
jgi:hypothetical protein